MIFPPGRTTCGRICEFALLIRQVLPGKPICIPTGSSDFSEKPLHLPTNALVACSKHRGGHKASNSSQLRHAQRARAFGPSGLRAAIVKYTAKAPHGCASNYSFKPRPLRGSANAVSCTTSPRRYAVRLNSGVRCARQFSDKGQQQGKLLKL